MNRVFLIRAASLYLPLAMATGLWLIRRPAKHEKAGLLLAMAWNAISILAINLIAIRAGWWRFEFVGGSLLGVPVDLYLGWIVLWGICPQLAFPKARLPIALVFFAVLDAVSMPKLSPVLALGSRWWLGELLALGCALLPSLLLARWTATQQRLYRRTTWQFLLFGGLAVWLLPTSIMALRGGVWPTWPSPGFRLWIQIVALAGMPSVAAVHEFATRGGGTPLPYDPPKQLVVTGPYAYVANPMQIGAVLMLLALGAALHNARIALAGVVAHVYSLGISAWDEGNDLSLRHGQRWSQYRQNVRNWLPRWRPWHEKTATLYVSASCGMCAEVGKWFGRRKATSLLILPAETYDRPLQRITYAHGDGSTEEGVVAIARALEHIHLGWAYVGWGMRLPLIHSVLQAVVDACGGEPRELQAGCGETGY